MLSVGLVDNLELLLGEFIGLAIRNKIGIKKKELDLTYPSPKNRLTRITEPANRAGSG